MNKTRTQDSDENLIDSLTPSMEAKLREIAFNSLLSAVAGINEKTAPDDDLFRIRTGVFVTLKNNGDLRGCIGFVQPIYTLREGVKRAASLAALEDPRFLPVSQEELDKIEIEITVLGEPQEITTRSELDLDKITIGEDGLIISGMNGSGLLLPQVAEEWGFTPKEFIEATCEKAGLSKSAWKDPANQIFKFKARVF